MFLRVLKPLIFLRMMFFGTHPINQEIFHGLSAITFTFFRHLQMIFDFSMMIK